MRTGDLIDFFACFTKLPVHINDVLDHMVEHGVRDRISLVPVDIDTEVLRGFVVQYEPIGRPYTSNPSCADVYYGINQNREWQRFVCCKELLHLLDNGEHVTSSREDLSNLIARIVLPPTLQNISEDGIQTLGDRIAEFKALAVLFPLGAREELMTPYRQGVLTEEGLARRADIPLRYARFLMLDTWDEIHHALTL